MQQGFPFLTDHLSSGEHLAISMYMGGIVAVLQGAENDIACTNQPTLLQALQALEDELAMRQGEREEARFQEQFYGGEYVTLTEQQAEARKVK